MKDTKTKRETTSERNCTPFFLTIDTTKTNMIGFYKREGIK